MEEVLAGIQNSQNGSVSSNDSEVVSSERMENVIVPDFIIRACRMLPVDSVLPMTNGLPNPRVADWKEDIQKAIVPVQPVMGCILLKLLAAHVEMPMVRELISIPTVVTKRPGAKTPLMDTWVRRSTRLNPNAVEGYKVVKAKEPVSKRRKRAVQKLDLGQPPMNVADAANPIPLDSIQEWALACGVSPTELLEDALLQGHDEAEN